jgi:anti-sigma factor (TIGR02949 family)
MDGVDRYTCEQALHRLDDYLDRELSREETERVREHLDLCLHCASRFSQEADLLFEIQNRLQRLAVPSGLRERLMGALLQAGPGR